MRRATFPEKCIVMILLWNTESDCVMLTEILRGARKAVELSQSMIILGKAVRRIPRHLSA